MDRLYEVFSNAYDFRLNYEQNTKKGLGQVYSYILELNKIRTIKDSTTREICLKNLDIAYGVRTKKNEL